MQYFKIALFLFACVVCSTLVGEKYNFAEADALFAQRDEGLATIAKARKAYETALAEAKETQDKIHAVEKLGKLAYFEGDLKINPDDKKTASKREGLFNECLSNVKHIEPKKIGKESGAYYFWYTSCLALWGNAAGPMRAVWHVGDMNKNLKKGLALDEKYDEGAFHRLAAAIYTRSKLLSILGLYNPDLALEHIEKSIKISDNYYNVYLLKAAILVEKGKKAEAKALLEAKSKELDERLKNGTLPKDVVPESKVYLIQLKALSARL